MSTPGITSVCGAACALLMLAACGGSGPPGAVVSREVRGDTIIVRTSGDAGVYTLQEEVRIGQLDGPDEYTFGSISNIVVDAEGFIHVLDALALEIRVYSPDGEFVRRFGRAGAGPGELGQPGGMAFLADGRLLVRDSRHGRMSIYSTQGEPLESWPIPGGFFTSAPVIVDHDGNVYSDIIADRSGPGLGRMGLLRLDRHGSVVDTLIRPLQDYEVPRLEAVSPDGNARSFGVVPFWPGPVVTLNRRGEFIAGISDRYALDVRQRDGRVLRIEREMDPVPVQSGEAQTAVERSTRGFRRTDPNWRWDGPRPPTVKPFFGAIRVADDDRIWVRVAQPAERQPPDPDASPDASGLPPLDRWVEPQVHDVFEADGTYFGRVALPEGLTLHAMRGDHVWGTVRDDFDVQYVVRLRIQR
jgi:hypothetical protein